MRCSGVGFASELQSSTLARTAPRLGARNRSPGARIVRHSAMLDAMGIAFVLTLAVAGAAAAQDDGVAMAEAAPLAVSSLLIDLAMAGNRIVAVGDRGHVLLSDDRGVSWQQSRQVPTRELLTGVCFADATHGIAVGHDEVVLTTQDAGETWKRTHYAPEAQQPLLDVWCGPHGAAIAVGAYGAYYESADGGASWTARRLDAKPAASAAAGRDAAAGSGSAGAAVDSAGTANADTAAGAEYAEDLGGDPHLNRIVAASATRFYVAAEAGHLYRSDDAGKSWVELRSPYEGSFFGVLPLSESTVLAYGLRGHLFRSEDAGSTWTEIETGTTAMLNDAARVAAQSVIVVGLSGMVLESRDGGKSFSSRAQSGRKGLSAVMAADAAGGAAAPAIPGEPNAQPEMPDEVIVAGEGGVRRLSLAQESDE